MMGCAWRCVALALLVTIATATPSGGDGLAAAVLDSLTLDESHDRASFRKTEVSVDRVNRAVLAASHRTEQRRAAALEQLGHSDHASFKATLQRANQEALAARAAATQRFEAAQKFAQEKSYRDSAQIEKHAAAEKQAAVEKWVAARGRARHQELEGYDKAQGILHDELSVAQKKFDSETKVAKAAYLQQLSQAETADMHKLVASTQQEVEHKGDAADDKAQELGKMGAEMSSPHSRTAFLSLQEGQADQTVQPILQHTQHQKVEDIVEQATAQQQVADSQVKAEGEKEATKSKQRALQRQQLIEQDQAQQISKAHQRYEEIRAAAEDKMTNAKTEAITQQQSELQDLANALKEDKVQIHQDAKTAKAAIETRTKAELQEQQEHYHKTTQLLQSDLQTRKSLAKTEADDEVSQANKAEQKALTAAAEERQRKIKAIATSPSERIEAGPLRRLLQLSEQDADDLAEMTSAQLAQLHQEEQRSDEQRAQAMLNDAQSELNDVIKAKQAQDSKLEQEEKVAAAEHGYKRAVATAKAQKLQQDQEADETYMSVTETAERAFREAQLHIAQKAAEAKIEASKKKNQRYDAANKIWQASKAKAREEQLSQFKRIEGSEDTSLKQYQSEYTASLQATKSAYSHNAAQVEEAKNTQLALSKKEAEQTIEKISGEAKSMQEEMSSNVVAQALTDGEPAVVHTD